MSSQRALTPEQETEVVSAYNADASTGELAEEYEVDPETIRRTLIRRNVPRRGLRTYEVDVSFFQDLQREEVAYWLGFIAADGHIGKERLLWLEISAKDKAHLHTFLEALDSDYPVHERERGGRVMAYLNLTCKALVQPLLDLGYGPGKNQRLELPPIRRPALRHFLRGYADGDGWTTLSEATGTLQLTWGIIGNPVFLQQVRPLLAQACGLSWVDMYLPSEDVEDLYLLQYTGNGNARKLYSYLYDDASVWLERKRKPFEEVL